MENVFDVLQERGYIAQATHEEEIRELLSSKKATFYIGFDPTADSLHVGHFLQLMVMSYLQKAGHTPITLIGGGTTMVGDPSGKTELRQMLTKEQIGVNAQNYKKQMSSIIDFSDGKAIVANNADWLLHLNYIDFIREVGVHFSVNRMLTAECFKNRLERGLTFFEFNYMLMQSYDFLELYRRHNCVLELGGDDQWSNIIGGVELVRKMEGAQVYGMTFCLLTNSEGKKMGKTEKGALWLDPLKTSPYDFYQYWRNVADDDVERCLRLLTFLPLEEIRSLTSGGADINAAKTVLAFEVTKIIHGEAEAANAKKAAEALFGGGGNLDNAPTTEFEFESFEKLENIIELMKACGLIASNSEGRRLIEQGGVSIDGQKVEEIGWKPSAGALIDGSLLIKVGKKKFHRVVVKQNLIN